MEIKTVEYGRLVSHGDHENTSLRAMSVLGDNDNPEEITESLKEWVEEQLEQHVMAKDDVYGLRDSADRLRWTIEDYQRQLQEAKKRWEAAVKLLGAHGIDIPKEPYEYFDDMPF